jgi:hypothetical protein
MRFSCGWLPPATPIQAGFIAAVGPAELNTVWVETVAQTPFAGLGCPPALDCAGAACA